MKSLQPAKPICGKIGTMNVAKPNLTGWLAGLPAKQSRAVHCTTSSLEFAIKRDGEKSWPESCVIFALADEKFAIERTE